MAWMLITMAQKAIACHDRPRYGSPLAGIKCLSAGPSLTGRSLPSTEPERMLAFRFKINEPVEEGFRRIAREQIDARMPSSGATHDPPNWRARDAASAEAPRALVRLSASALGRGDFTPTDETRSAKLPACCRHAGIRPLCSRRSRSSRWKPVPDGAVTLAPLRAHLVAKVEKRRSRSTSIARPRPASCGSGRPRNSPARDFAVAASHALDRWSRDELRPSTQGHREMPTASLRMKVSMPGVRRAQWHWRQMRLLARAWPDEFAVRVSAARELSQMLGDDHDLAMLVAVACNGGWHIVRAQAMRSLGAVSAPTAGIAQRRRISRGAAFRREPKAFTKRMAAYWEVRPCSRPTRVLRLCLSAHPDVQISQVAAETGHHPPAPDTKPVRSKRPGLR